MGELVYCGQNEAAAAVHILILENIVGPDVVRGAHSQRRRVLAARSRAFDPLDLHRHPLSEVMDPLAIDGALAPEQGLDASVTAVREGLSDSFQVGLDPVIGGSTRLVLVVGTHIELQK